MIFSWVPILMLSASSLSAAGAAAPSAQVHTRISGPACEDGSVLDDGTIETGYGWVPSAIWGEYVQQFPAEDITSTILDSICICWTRTREDDSLDFEIVAYRDVGGHPDASPFLVIPAHVDDVPLFGEGRFYEIQTAELSKVFPSGTWDIGVRWNPSQDQFFFLCADQSPTDDPVPGYFRDDRAEGEWGSVLDTNDPMFARHRAMMVRPRTLRVGWVPTLQTSGLVVLFLLVSASGYLLLRGR